MRGITFIFISSIVSLLTMLLKATLHRVRSTSPNVEQTQSSEKQQCNVKNTWQYLILRFHKFLCIARTGLVQQL